MTQDGNDADTLNEQNSSNISNEIINALHTVVELAYIAISDDGKIAEEDLPAAHEIKKVENYLKTISLK